MCLSLRSEGKSYREIASELSERFNTDISHQSVKNYLEEHKDEKLGRMTEENRGYLQQEKVERIIDVNDKLEKMESKLDTILDETLSEHDKQDVGQILSVMKEIRKMMKFQKEYLEEVTSPEKEVNNYDITNNMTAIQFSEKLQEYERQGIIDIKKPGELKK